MSRYRKIEVRTWGDAKFRCLSAMPPCAQGLWLYLLTGPHTSAIPGLFRAGRAGMAEELEWNLEAFDKAFGEVLAQGMVKADFSARVVWVPNAIKHNRPESPNVVKAWAAEFDLIPECDLKAEACASIISYLSTLGAAFLNAFKPSGKALVKNSVEALPKTRANQEQEQEQEKAPLPPTRTIERDPDTDRSALVERIICAHPRSILRNLEPADIRPAQSVAVFEAAKCEMDRSGCLAEEALQMILERTRSLAEHIPREEWRFLKDVPEFYRSRDYRLDPSDFAGRQHGSNRNQQRTNGNRDAARRAAQAIAGGDLDSVGGGAASVGQRGDAQAVRGQAIAV